LMTGRLALVPIIIAGTRMHLYGAVAMPSRVRSFVSP
jgi:hypothetical protein